MSPESSRNEGCHALAVDNGQESVRPVCMGGGELIGCNQPTVCEPRFRVRHDGDCFVYLISNDGQRIVGVEAHLGGPR